MITAQAATAPSWLPSLRAGARSRAPPYVARSGAPVTSRGHEPSYIARSRAPVTPRGHEHRHTSRGHEHRSLPEVTSTVTPRGREVSEHRALTPRGHEHVLGRSRARESALVGAVRWPARWPTDGSPREFMGRPPCQGRFASLLRRDQVAARPDPLTWSLSAARRRSLRAGFACPPVPRGDPTPGAALTASSPTCAFPHSSTGDCPTARPGWPSPVIMTVIMIVVMKTDRFYTPIRLHQTDHDHRPGRGGSAFVGAADEVAAADVVEGCFDGLDQQAAGV